MGRRWFDDLTGDDLADDDVHALVVTLDGDPLAAFDVGGRPPAELLADLGGLLTGTAVPLAPLDPGPLDESAGNLIQPSVAQPVESPAVSVKSPVTDTPAAAVAVSDTPEPQQVGEAVQGKASDAQVRAWNDLWELGDLRSRRRVPAWLREQYERLAGAEPDDGARRVAALQQPPAAGPAGQDPPTSGERAGPPASRTSGRSEPPAIDPVGDDRAAARPSRARPEQLEKARELAADNHTPMQICDLTGVSLDEARAAVAEDRKERTPR